MPAVKRAIKVLETLAAARRPLALGELTTRLALPKSSVLGICATLVESGVLQRTPSGTYRLGVRLVDLAHAYLAESNITSQFVETWEAMGTLPEETVVLSVLDGTDVIYVGCQSGAHGLTFSYRIGMRLPATCTASGKALLSTLPKETLDTLFAGRNLTRMTKRSLRTLRDLHRDMAAIRSRGYAIDEEETKEGMCCIGVPVFDASGSTAVAAVAISMFKAEFATAKRERLAHTVLGFSKALSSRLGGYRQSVMNGTTIQG